MIRPKNLASLVVLALAVAALWVWPDSADSPANSANSGGLERSATVERVSDGDTIGLRIDNESVRVRLIGVDAPEIHTSTDCGGQESLAALSALVASGDRVTVMSDASQAERDRYDRILAYIHRTDGTDVGRAQIESGWAQVYRHGSRFTRYGDYEDAESSARQANLGVWKHC